MTSLFRNSSPNALTLKQSIELEKKRRAERHRQMRQARELAAQGRGEDTEIAHVARGEYVIPEALQTPELLTALRRAAAAKGIPLEMLSIGNAMNSINPATGVREFGGTAPDFEMPKMDSFENASRVPNANIEVPLEFPPHVAAAKDQWARSQASPPYAPPADGVGAIPPISAEKSRFESRIVQNQRQTPTNFFDPNRYNPKLVPARENDLKIPAVNAFLDLISNTEGAGYHTLIGTDQFPLGRLTSDLSRFPNRGLNDKETHSGAFQIKESVYDDLSGQMGLKGFEPQVQRLMAAQLLQRATGGVPGGESALEALRRGDYDKALELSRLTWTSLPGAKEPNKNISPDQARSYFNERLKQYESR